MYRHSARFSLLLIISVLSSSLFAQQAQTSTPPAPIPSQILSGTKVFISYAGMNYAPLVRVITKFTGSPNGYYDQFYAGMKSWGRYELVSSPSDADLVFEISIHYQRDDLPQLKLRIVDPKTHVILWALVEQTELSPKDWAKAVPKLVDDARTLTTSAQVPARQ